MDGAEKKAESVLGLMRARKYLARRFGSAHVNFGDPISLAQALGDRRESFVSAGTGALIEEKRRFVERFGHRLVEQISWSAAANATSVAAAVLLSSPYRGMRRDSFVRRMHEVVGVLELQEVKLSNALAQDLSDFDESIAFLQWSDFIRSSRDRGGEIIYFEQSRRRALDIYRNSIAHFLVSASFLSRRLLAGPMGQKDLEDDLRFWQNFFYQEYYTPRADDVARRLRIHLEHFESQGWVLRLDAATSEYSVSAKGQDVLVFFAAQTRGVLAAYRALFEGLAEIDGEIRRSDIYRRAKEKFENARLLGEPAGVESANGTTLSNALELLESRGVLQRLPAEGKRSARDPAFAFGEHGRDLTGLTQRLASALADR
jgi:glycerol-3-phosphate O-acyltransferase